ncbi:MAG: hypothetical protein SFY92_06155 [Verrucomicrobiae bacterium]|nr:hypothetical protein [Verrucomicrobiae bacterium]
MEKPEELLRAAEQVVQILEDHKVASVVIGAVAMAAYHYVRMTRDIDLGVNTDVQTLQTIATSLRHKGFNAELREPDESDPLGGVIDVTGPFGLIQIVSFANRFPAVIEDALHTKPVELRPGSLLRLAPLPQLVAMKLYAGGLKSKVDITELLTRNPGTDLEEIRTVCNRYRLSGLDEILREI